MIELQRHSDAGTLEYVADSMLLQRIEAMDWALSRSKGMEKVAFDLGGEKSIIHNAVSSIIDTSSTGSIIKSVLKLLETGVLFKISPLLGIASMIGQGFGFSITDWVSSAVSKIKPRIQEEGEISPQEVNEAVAQSAPGGAIGATAMLGDLHELEKKGELVLMLTHEPIKKEARSWWQAGKPILGSKSTPWYYRAFGFLTPRNRKKLLGGMIAWVLKTALLGAGILTIGGAAASMLGLPSPMPGKQKQQNEQQTLEPTVPSPATPGAPKPPAGLRQTMPMAQTPFGSWMGPNRMKQLERMTPEQLLQRYKATQAPRKPQQTPGLMFRLAPNGTPGDVVWQYAVEQSPHLSQYQSILSKLPSFNSAVSALSAKHTPGQQTLMATPQAAAQMKLFVLDANRKFRQLQKEQKA